MTNDIEHARIQRQIKESAHQLAFGMPAISPTPSEDDAYKQGREAFRQGVAREACPYSAPIVPIRTPGDATAGSASLGAFWLDGWEHERDGIGPAQVET